MKFTDFNLNEQLLEAISYLGFEKATEIQEKVIPIIQDNKDLIACAQTGTGKTQHSKLQLSSHSQVSAVTVKYSKPLQFCVPLYFGKALLVCEIRGHKMSNPNKGKKRLNDNDDDDDERAQNVHYFKLCVFFNDLAQFKGVGSVQCTK